MKTPGIPLRQPDRTFADPLLWLEKMTARGKFPSLPDLAERFLAIPATSGSSERIWKRGDGVITDERSRLKSEVASGTVFLQENENVLRKHYATVAKTTKGAKLAPLYLPENEASKPAGEVVVGQDLFLLKL